eukprot:1579126-Rhodomonas_salina.1
MLSAIHVSLKFWTACPLCKKGWTDLPFESSGKHDSTCVCANKTPACAVRFETEGADGADRRRRGDR